jgi:sigma-B regulation protein RsbU (phosphoserine phosphatase)
MKEDCLYEQRTIPLHPGDVLYLFTDGFTDAMNGQNEIFGLDRLVQTIGRDELGGLQAKKQIEVVSREIQRHVGAAPQHDDMTMVVVKVL